MHDCYPVHCIQPLLHIHDVGMSGRCQISPLLFTQALEVSGGPSDPLVMFTGAYLRGSGVRRAPSLINYCPSEWCGKRADLPAHQNTREMSFHPAEAPLAVCCLSSGRGLPAAHTSGCMEAGATFPYTRSVHGAVSGGGIRGTKAAPRAAGEGEGCRFQRPLSLRHPSGVSTTALGLSPEVIPHSASSKSRSRFAHNALFGDDVLLSDTSVCQKNL